LKAAGSRGSRLVPKERLNAFVNLIADAPEGGLPFRLATFNRGRILEAPVNARRPRWKHRTVVAGVVADRDHIVERMS
jgi:hypothetical protein